MSAIFLPRRWRHQPRDAVEVDWGSALSNRLEIAYLPQLAISLGKRPGTVSGTLEIGAGSSGTYSRSTSYSAANYIDYGTVPGSELITWPGSSTLAVFDFWLGGPGGVFPGLVGGTWSGNYYGAGLLSVEHDTGTNNKSLSWRGPTSTTLSGRSVDGSSNNFLFSSQRVTAVGTYNNTSRAMRLLIEAEKEGRRDVSAVASGTFPNSTQTLRVGSYERSGNRTLFMPLYVAAMWSRQLTEGEALALRENPWQLFRARSHRIWFDLGAGGSPGIYTLDAQPISIGASPQTGSPLAKRRLSADSASVTITGEIATLVKIALVSGVWDTGKWDQSLWDTEVLTYSFAADPVQVALTGGEAATAAIRRLSADPATTSITAQASATLAKRALDAQAVSVAVTGADAGLNKLGSYSIEAQPITLSLTAQAAGLAVIRRLSADPITVALTAAPATGYARRLLAADAVAVSISGMEAGLHRSGYYPLEAGPAPVSILLADAGLVVNRLGQSVRSTGGGGSGGGHLWRQMGEEIEEEMHALLRDPEPVVAHPVDASPLKAAVVAALPEERGTEEAFAEALREYQLAQAALLQRRRERRKRILLLS